MPEPSSQPHFQKPYCTSEPQRTFAFRKDLRGSRHFYGFWSHVKYFRLWCGTKNIESRPSFNSPRICYKVKRLAERFGERGGSRSAWRTVPAGAGPPLCLPLLVHLHLNLHVRPCWCPAGPARLLTISLLHILSSLPKYPANGSNSPFPTPCRPHLPPPLSVKSSLTLFLQRVRKPVLGDRAPPSPWFPVETLNSRWAGGLAGCAGQQGLAGAVVLPSPPSVAGWLEATGAGVPAARLALSFS